MNSEGNFINDILETLQKKMPEETFGKKKFRRKISREFLEEIFERISKGNVGKLPEK